MIKVRKTDVILKSNDLFFNFNTYERFFEFGNCFSNIFMYVLWIILIVKTCRCFVFQHVCKKRITMKNNQL